MIELIDIVYDERARNGYWCVLPYPDHPNGCPNFPQCPQKYPDFKNLIGYKWFAVIEEFDLKKHAERMKQKHPDWSDRQCRCVLYWQGSVRKKLRDKTYALTTKEDMVLESPEASGVNLFATMAKVGIILKKNPDYVYKIMMIGRKTK
jgi:hypothetical protein